jgi:protein tyrosine/serine phosphatase
MFSQRVYRSAAVLLAVLTLITSSIAASSPVNTPIGIRNFGKISDSYYRGAQPTARDFPALAALGIRTVLDLRLTGESSEQARVEQAGMKFYQIPMTTSDRPSDAAVSQFLDIVNNPANQPVFVHCQEGRHRTGVMTAIYRIATDGWTADRAYAEMDRFNFESFFGHPTLKKFVYDYYREFARTHDRQEKTVLATIIPK